MVLYQFHRDDALPSEPYRMSQFLTLTKFRNHSTKNVQFCIYLFSPRFHLVSHHHELLYSLEFKELTIRIVYCVFLLFLYLLFLWRLHHNFPFELSFLLLKTHGLSFSVSILFVLLSLTIHWLIILVPSLSIISIRISVKSRRTRSKFESNMKLTG